MSLKSLDLLYQYRHDQDNIVDDFYIPCLRESVMYRRAVGYFSSGALALVARGLSVFLESNNGKMQLIASPLFEKEDIDAIVLGYRAREDILSETLIRAINEGMSAEEPIFRKRLSFLAYLVANERLDIRIATLSDPRKTGIYHEKIGLFADVDRNVVAFTGSSNETVGGLYINFEAVEVFCSWRDGDKERVQNKMADFDRLWSNSTPGLEVVDFPLAAKQRLIRIAEEHHNEFSYDPESLMFPQIKTSENLLGWPSLVPHIPKDLRLRDYQIQAIKVWFQNEGSGILEMATGTGKTITSLAAAIKLLEAIKRLCIIIVAPYKHLVEQWANEARFFGFHPILAYEQRHAWESVVSSSLLSLQIDSCKHVCIITTKATFDGDCFREMISSVKDVPILLIADEVHHLGASNIRKRLNNGIKYRLGLSATPERWYDEEGTETVREYFSPGVIFKFGLEDALKAGYLTPYNYYPHIVELTEEENEEYKEITRKMVLFVNNKEDIQNNEQIKKLLIARARILNRAMNKLVELKKLMQQAQAHESTHNLFYCGDAIVDGVRQVDSVVKMLGCEIGIRVHPFTSEENQKERQRLLHSFDSGDLQGLVAIRCLDEGVDIPSARTAYILASSTNPREFIQRRGRLLRKHPTKKVTYIHDFIVIPRSLDELSHIEPTVFNMERKIVRRELTRTLEFCNLARNGPEASKALNELKMKFNSFDL
jgi:DNA phosphorothioation system restriction enzyme